MAGQSASKNGPSTFSENLYREVAEELRLFRQLLIDVFAFKNSLTRLSQPETMFVAQTKERTTNSDEASRHVEDGVTVTGGSPGSRLPLKIVCQSCGSDGVVFATTTPEGKSNTNIGEHSRREEEVGEARGLEAIKRQVFAPRKQDVPLNGPNRQTDDIDPDEEKDMTSKRHQGHSHDLKDKCERDDLSSHESIPRHEQKLRTAKAYFRIDGTKKHNKVITSAAVKEKDRPRKRSGSHGRSISHGREKKCRRKDLGTTDRNHKPETMNIVDKACQNIKGIEAANGPTSNSNDVRKYSPKNETKTDNAHPEKNIEAANGPAAKFSRAERYSPKDKTKTDNAHTEKNREVTNGPATKSSHAKRYSPKNKSNIDSAHAEKIPVYPKETRRPIRKANGDRRTSPHKSRRFTFDCRGKSSRTYQRRNSEDITSNNTATEDTRRHTDRILTFKIKEVRDRHRTSPHPSDLRSKCQLKSKFCSSQRHPFYSRRSFSNNSPKDGRRRESSIKEGRINKGRYLSELSQREMRSKMPNCQKPGMYTLLTNDRREPGNKGSRWPTDKTKPSEERARHVDVSLHTGYSKTSGMHQEMEWGFIQMPQSLSLVDLRFTEKIEVRGSHSFSEGMAENISLGIVNAHLWCENRQLAAKTTSYGNRERSVAGLFDGHCTSRSLAKLRSCAAKLRHYYRVYMRPQIIEFLRARLAYVKLFPYLFKTNGSVYKCVSLLAVPSCYVSDPRILFLDLVKYFQALSPFAEKNNIAIHSKSKRGVSNRNCSKTLKEPSRGKEARGYYLNSAKSQITGSRAIESMDTSSEMRIDKQNVLDLIEEFCDTTPPLSPLADSLASGGVRQCAFLRSLIEDADLFENVATYVYRTQTHDRMKQIFIDNQSLDSFTQDDTSSNPLQKIEYMNLLAKHEITKQAEVKNSPGKSCQPELAGHYRVNETTLPCSSSESMSKSFTDIKINTNNSSDEKSESTSGTAKKTALPMPSDCEQDFEIIDFSYEYDMLNSPIVLNASDRVYRVHDIPNENTEGKGNGDEEASSDISTILGQIRNSDDILATAMDSAGLTESAVEDFLNADFDLDSVIFDQNAVDSSPCESQNADAFLDQIFAGFSSLDNASSSDTKDTFCAWLQESTEGQTEAFTMTPRHIDDDHINGLTACHEFAATEICGVNEGWEFSCPWTTETDNTEAKQFCIGGENAQVHCENKNHASDLLRGTDQNNDQNQEPFELYQFPPVRNSEIQEALRNTNNTFHFDSSAENPPETIKIHNTRSSIADPTITLRGDKGAALVCPENNMLTDEEVFVSKLNKSSVKKTSKRQAKTVTARKMDYGFDSEAPSKAMTTLCNKRRAQGRTQQPHTLSQPSGLGKPKSTETEMPTDLRTKSLGVITDSCNEATAQAQNYRRPHTLLKRRLRSASVRKCQSASQDISALLPTYTSKSARTAIRNSNNNADILDSSSSDVSEDQFACSSSTTTATEDTRQEKLSHRLKQRCRELEKHYRKRYQSPLGSTFASSMPLPMAHKNRSQNSRRPDDKSKVKANPTGTAENLQAGLSRGTRLKSSVINFVRRIQGGYGDQFPISTRTTKEKRHELCNRYLEYHGIDPTEQPTVKHKKKHKRRSYQEPSAQNTVDESSKGSKTRKSGSGLEKGRAREQRPTDDNGSAYSTQSSSNVTRATSATSISSSGEGIEGSKDEGRLHNKAPCNSDVKKKTDSKGQSLSETTAHKGRFSPTFSSSRPSTPELVARLEAKPFSSAYRLMKKIEQFELDFQTRFPAAIVETSNNAPGTAVATTSDSMRPKANRSNKRSKKSPAKTPKKKEIQSLLLKFENLDIDSSSSRTPFAPDSGRDAGARGKLELPPIKNMHVFTPKSSNQSKSVDDSPDMPPPTPDDGSEMADSDGDNDLLATESLQDILAQDNDEPSSGLFGHGEEDVNEAADNLIKCYNPKKDQCTEMPQDESSNESYSGCHRLVPNLLSTNGLDSPEIEVNNKDGQPKTRLSTSQVSPCLPKLGTKSLSVSALSATSNADEQSQEVDLSISDKAVIAANNTSGENEKQASLNATPDDAPGESETGSGPSQNASEKPCIDIESFDSLDELWASYEKLIISDTDNEGCADKNNDSLMSSPDSQTTKIQSPEKANNITAANPDSMTTSSVDTRENDSGEILGEDLLDHSFLEALLSQESMRTDLDPDGYQPIAQQSPESRSSRCPWPANIKVTQLSPIMEDDEEIDAA